MLMDLISAVISPIQTGSCHVIQDHQEVAVQAPCEN